MRKIDLIVIHCSATAIEKPYSKEDLERDHKARGFSSIGYHFYIRRDGTIYECRPINKIGAHVFGYNSNSIGLCYEGGIVAGGNANRAQDAKDTRTDAQKKSIKSVIKGLYDKLGDHQDCSDIEIVGHRDLSPDVDGDGIVEPWEWLKQCPCYDVKEENYEQLINKKL